MNIETYKQRVNSSIDLNFESIKPYKEFRSVIFGHLIFSINEVCSCLMLNSNIAAITMTNYLLENLLRLALTEDWHELAPIPYPPQEHWQMAHDKFSKLMMYDKIVACHEKGLISEEQRIYLNKVIKEQYRNGFSHSDTDKILKDFPDEKKLTETWISTKADPGYQMTSTMQFAKENALKYLDFVVKLIQDIEDNLQKKHPGNLVLIYPKQGGVLRLFAKGVNPDTGIPNTNGPKKRG